MAEASTDTFADALMAMLQEDGEGVPSQEGQKEEEVAPPAEEAAPPAPDPQAQQTPDSTLDFEQRYAARRTKEQAQEQARTREAELQKLMEDGDPAEIGTAIKREYAELQVRNKVASQTEQAVATKVFEGALDAEFVKALSDEEAVELYGYTQKLDTPNFLKRVLEIRGGKAPAAPTDIEAEVERRVQEKLTAAQNLQRGNQLRSPSPTAAPTASSEGVPMGASNDDLWAAAFEDLRETVRG